LDECKILDLKKRDNNRQGFKKIMHKINEIRNDACDIDNFVPHLQEFEEQKLLQDARIGPLGKNLSMTKLKSPYVLNNMKYTNEDRFSTLFNSNNC